MTRDPLEIQKNYRNDQLILVVRDVVIKKLKINIDADSKLAAALEAKLLGKLQKVVGDSAQLGIKLSKLSKRSFAMEITTPVVAGFLAVRKGADSRGEKIKTEESAITGWSKSWAIKTVPVLRDTKPNKKAR